MAAKKPKPRTPPAPAPAPVNVEQELRTAALDASDDEDDKGATNAREYFARCNRPMGSSATIEDLCGVLEYFGMTELPEGHATPHPAQ